MSGLKTATAIALAMGVAGAMILTEPAHAAQDKTSQQSGQQSQSGQQQASAQVPQACQLSQFQSPDGFFDEFDRNSDDVVQLDEYLSCLQSAGAEASEDARRTLEQQFTSLDQNGDKQIKRDELEQGALQSASRQMGDQQQAQGAKGTQVEVHQQPAQVEVQEKQPKIMVQEQPAEIQVEQRQPEVTVNQPDAQVKVIQPEPEVTIKQPEPEIKVTEAQPKVQVQDAKPEVEVEQAEREQTRQLNQQQSRDEQSKQGTSGSSEQQAQAQESEQSEQSARTTTGGTMTGGADAEQMRAEAERLIGQDVINRNGEQVAELTDLVVHPTSGDLHAVLSIGGFLGLGDKEVTVPLDRLQLGGENITLMSQKDEEQLEQMPDYDEGEWKRLDE